MSVDLETALARLHATLHGAMTVVRNIAELFFDAVSLNPERDALVLEDQRLSYASLAVHVNRLRACLDPARDRGLCAVFASRSPTAYAAVLAILASGQAYVPLNPRFPALRNRYIVERTGLRTLLVGPECAVELRELIECTGEKFLIVTLERDPNVAALLSEYPERLTWHVAECETSRVQPAPAKVSGDSPAYVLFTSGSTGQPKGVVVSHANVCSYLRSLHSLYPLGSDDRLSQTFDLTFDLSVHDMFACYSAGAALVVFPQHALAAPIPYARERRVTVWFSVPSMAAFLEAKRQVEPGALPDVRLSFFCGEKLTWNTLRVWKTIAPNSRVVNLYGPTETTIAITHFEVPAEAPRERDSGTVPIGHAFAGQIAQVWKSDGAQCPVGEVGALWLAGDQVSAGYLSEPLLTAARFVAKGDTLFYRTGDLARLDADGVLHFVGREDSQVKLMGHRVELGEVEHVLAQVSGAACAIADVAVSSDGVEELFAVLTGPAVSDKKRLKQLLKAALPSYMQPRHYFVLEELPRNSSGKIDRAAVRERIQRMLSGP
jgi:D-alanine--poly(phosphoribitol) ligase subunit 1